MSDNEKNLKFLDSHEWARDDDGVVTVGISNHAQELLGDIVYVELPQIGSNVSQKDGVAIVESVKAASDLYMPVGGEVYEINDQLNDSPEILNESPYENGWIIKIKPNSSDEFSSLLTSVQYKKEIGVL
jgi:glycine cleavage system H protein